MMLKKPFIDDFFIFVRFQPLIRIHRQVIQNGILLTIDKLCFYWLDSNANQVLKYEFVAFSYGS